MKWQEDVRIPPGVSHGTERLSDLIERAYDLFREEYHEHFPRSGDAQDHDEAQRAAIEAVVELVLDSDERLREVAAAVGFLYGHFLTAEVEDRLADPPDGDFARLRMLLRLRGGWRCECGDLNHRGEAFCFRCGGGSPELPEDFVSDAKKEA